MRLLLWNLILYSAQMAAIVAVGALISALVHAPKVRLMHWYGVLLACVIVPFVSLPFAGPVVNSGVIQQVRIAAQSTLQNEPEWLPFLGGVWLTGVAMLLVRLIMRCRVLGRLKRESTPVQGLSLQADFRTCTAISSPLTFGWRNPVVLLPPSFFQLKPEQQKSVAFHELMHVWHNDWLKILGEELLRALLWFHPGVWFALSRIQEAREQAVDEEVVNMTGDRDSYVDALVTVAGIAVAYELTPAPSLLRRHLFAERLRRLLDHRPQTPLQRSLIALASIAATIAVATITAQTLPLDGNSARWKFSKPPARVGGNVQALKLINRVKPVYPPLAKQARIQGTVRLDCIIDADGVPVQLELVNGHPLLVPAALDAVRQWRYAPSGYAVRTRIDINYTLAP